MFVPRLCNFCYDKWGYGHATYSRFWGIPVPTAGVYVYVTCPFLCGCLVFIADGNPVLVMPLITIYGTLRTGNTLYILCNNGALHYFDRKTHQHWVSFLDNTDEDLFNSMFN